MYDESNVSTCGIAAVFQEPLQMAERLTELGELLTPLLDPVLWLVTAQFGENTGGLIATFVQQASLVPTVPRMLIAIAKHHHTWDLIARSRSFSLHLIREAQIEWVDRFGLHSGRTSDKFAGLQTRTGVTGSPILEGAVLCIECRVETSMDTGDRTVYLGEVVSFERGVDGPPLRLKRTLELLTEQQRSELRRRTVNDIELDKAAIHAWRASQNVIVHSDDLDR
jgi:flavin reductase (DIM6/NTAB) family NADH-FMN oxidoreductase RutF